MDGSAGAGSAGAGSAGAGSAAAGSAGVLPAMSAQRELTKPRINANEQDQEPLRTFRAARSLQARRLRSQRLRSQLNPLRSY